MNTTTSLMTFGTISKLETITPLKDNVLSNTVVFETKEPFPGYHGKNLPSDSIPLSIFLATSVKYEIEEIFRITKEIKQLYRSPFEASGSSISLYDSSFDCIRIWGLKTFEIISDIQIKFQERGIKFLKGKAMEGEAFIKISKPFQLEKTSEGIYLDIHDKQMYYIEIPFFISWDQFLNISYKIKNNINLIDYDAALGSFFLSDIVHIIRIFGTKLGIQDLEQIKTMYIKEINSIA